MSSTFHYILEMEMFAEVAAFLGRFADANVRECGSCGIHARNMVLELRWRAPLPMHICSMRLKGVTQGHTSVTKLSPCVSALPLTR